MSGQQVRERDKLILSYGRLNRQLGVCRCSRLPPKQRCICGRRRVAARMQRVPRTGSPTLCPRSSPVERAGSGDLGGPEEHQHIQQNEHAAARAGGAYCRHQGAEQGDAAVPDRRPFEHPPSACLVRTDPCTQGLWEREYSTTGCRRCNIAVWLLAPRWAQGEGGRCSTPAPSILTVRCTMVALHPRPLLLAEGP